MTRKLTAEGAENYWGLRVFMAQDKKRRLGHKSVNTPAYYAACRGLDYAQERYDRAERKGRK